MDGGMFIAINTTSIHGIRFIYARNVIYTFGVHSGRLGGHIVSKSAYHMLIFCNDDARTSFDIAIYSWRPSIAIYLLLVAVFCNILPERGDL